MMLQYFISNPKGVGALFSSSRFCANAVVDLIHPDANVLEVGAGDGAITKYLVKHGFGPDQLTICEYDRGLCEELLCQFPEYDIYWQDAGLLHRVLPLASFDVIVCAVPVIMFPDDVIFQRLACFSALLKPGGRLLQLSYKASSPYEQCDGQLAKYVPWNLPPMYIWEYQW